MSQHGNRSNPNGVRVDGKPDTSPQNPNRSDITDKMQTDSKSPGGREPMMHDGSQQESRDHNKHNNSGPSRHKPEHHHSASEEKH